jgi:hypothetical protein
VRIIPAASLHRGCGGLRLRRPPPRQAKGEGVAGQLTECHQLLRGSVSRDSGSYPMTSANAGGADAIRRVGRRPRLQSLCGRRLPPPQRARPYPEPVTRRANFRRRLGVWPVAQPLLTERVWGVRPCYPDRPRRALSRKRATEYEMCRGSGGGGVDSESSAR